MSEIQNTNDHKSKAVTTKLSTFIRRANTLAERGMYDEAIENVKQAMAIYPREPKCSLQLANIYRAQNRMGQAIEAMKKAVELDPLNATVQEQLLRTLLELERYDDAISTSKKLLKLSPKNIFARDILGVAYLQQGMLDKALKVTNDLIRLAPTDSTHYFKKAVLLQQKGEISSAMDAYLRVLEMSDNTEIIDDTRAAIAALDSYQLKQILTILIEDPVFRAKLALDFQSALEEKGFKLSTSGMLTLKQINIDDLPEESISRYYH